MGNPVYFVAATVPSGNRLRRFFDDGADSPVRLIAEPPRFRWAGFDLTTLGEATLVEGNCFEVRGGDRKVIRLCQDGTLITRVAADPAFLGWGQEPEYFEREPRLNPVPVVEFNTAFVHLYANLMTYLVNPADTVHFDIQIRNSIIGNHRLALTQYYKDGIRNIHRPRLYYVQSSDPEETLELDAGTVQRTPGVAAYRVVKAFYSMFDMEPELIPFTTETPDGEPAIDITKIKGL